MDLPAGNALPASASRAPAAALWHVPGALLQTTSDGRTAFSGGTLAGMKRDELVAWLNQYLDIGAYRADPSMNGLQVQGSAINRRYIKTGINRHSSWLLTVQGLGMPVGLVRGRLFLLV